MTYPQAYVAIEAGASRYSVVWESDGTRSVVDKQVEGSARYPVSHVAASTAWKIAARLEIERRRA